MEQITWSHLAGGTRWSPSPGAARLGAVRLGQLRVHDHHHRGGLSHLLPQRGRRGRAGDGRALALRLVDDDRDGRSPRVIAPILGAYADLRRRQEAAAAHLPGDRRDRHGGHVVHRAGRLAPGADPVRGRQHRRLGRLHVLRLAPAARGAAGRAGPRVDRRLRARLPRAAGCCSSSICSGFRSRSGSASPTPASRPGCRSSASRSGGSLFSIPLFRRVPEPPSQRSWRVAGSVVGVARSRGSAGRCATSPSTGRRCCCWWRSSSTTTASAPSSGWRRLYGEQIGIAQQHLIFALLLVQFVGIPFAFLFGRAGGVGSAPRTPSSSRSASTSSSACSATT